MLTGCLKVLFRIFHSSCWTTNDFKAVVLKFFLIMGYFITGLFLLNHCPQEPYATWFSIPLFLSFFPSSLVLAPSCELPWPLFRTPVVISSPRSLWLSAVGYSKWLGGPSISLHVVILPGDWKAGGGWLKCGVGSAEGWWIGRDEDGEYYLWTTI